MAAQRTLDLNGDLGEGASHDAELMALVTSVSIACGFHAGGPERMLRALTEAAHGGVYAGAHPGFPDREHFGRRELDRPEARVFEDCVYQVGALAGLARAAGRPLTHLKPHGALYNMACRLDEYARPVVAAAELFGLPVYGLPGSRLEQACAGRCPFIPEGFADRRYRPDGSLVPRDGPDAFVTDPQEAARQADWLLSAWGIRTLCVHGDSSGTLAFTRALRDELLAQGIHVKPLTG